MGRFNFLALMLGANVRSIMLTHVAPRIPRCVKNRSGVPLKEWSNSNPYRLTSGYSLSVFQWRDKQSINALLTRTE